MDYLETFDVTTAVMQSEAELHRIATEFVEGLLAFQLDAAQGAFLRWDQTKEVIDQLLEAYPRTRES